MNHDKMRELYEKYPFAYFRQTKAPDLVKYGMEQWITIPDEDTDFFDGCDYRLYPVVNPTSSEPTENMIEKGAVFLGKIAIYAREVKMPENVTSFTGWRHFANRSYTGWEYCETLSGRFSNNPMVYCIDPDDPNADEIIEMNALKRKNVEPCPFCGLQLDIFEPDFCYPLNLERTMYRAGCMESAGGCSAEVLGDDLYEAIDNWNRRYDNPWS